MGKRLSPDKVEYIRTNAPYKSDRDIAKELGVHYATVIYHRKRLGYKKGPGGKIEELTPPKRKVEDPTVEIEVGRKKSVGMSEDQKKAFFKQQLVNSLYYDEIKKQLTTEEINFYLEEWAALCVQFQDIVATEKRQIDELIKTSIMDNRLLRNIKIAEDEIKLLQNEVERLRCDPHFEDDIWLQERDDNLIDLINTISGQCKSMNKDHTEFVRLKGTLLDNLKARRKDREDQIKQSGKTFASMVKAFNDNRVRETQGRHTELLRLAKEKKKKELRKKRSYPDGSIDNMILDEHSVVEEEDENAEKDTSRDDTGNNQVDSGEDTESETDIRNDGGES